MLVRQELRCRQPRPSSKAGFERPLAFALQSSRSNVESKLPALSRLEARAWAPSMDMTTTQMLHTSFGQDALISKMRLAGMLPTALGLPSSPTDVPAIANLLRILCEHAQPYTRPGRHCELIIFEEVDMPGLRADSRMHRGRHDPERPQQNGFSRRSM